MSRELATIGKFLEDYKSQITAALPSHLNADRMVRLALTAFSQNKALLKCDPTSVFGAVVIASQLGLEIGVAGHGFLVPYKNRAQFVPGWQGLVDLVSRSGRGTVWTGGVFEGDDFSFALGDSPFVKHLPRGEDDPEKLIHTYAVGRPKGSEWPIIEVWPIARVWRHRDKHNKVGDDHYSFKHPEMYARKVPLLQVIKYMPKSIELSNALALEEAAETGHNPTIMGDFVVVEKEDNGDGEGSGACIEGPKSKSGAAPAAAEADRPPAQDRLLTDGERNHLRGKMEAAALTEADLKGKFGVGLDGITKSQFEDVRRWAANPAKTD